MNVYTASTYDELLGHRLLEDAIDWETGEVLAGKGEIIKPRMAQGIANAGLAVKVQRYDDGPAYFTRQEAGGKVGQRIATLVDFSGVPQGTTGRVLRADQAGGGYHLAIAWDLPGRSKPLVDWFNRREYYFYLKELPCRTATRASTLSR